MNINVTDASPVNKEQNVSWNDQTPGYKTEVVSNYDETRTNTDANDVDLGNFFERPLKIASFEWATTTTFFQAFDPWSLYLENPRVANRISNYKLFKGKLHVRFMINGNAFYYGRLLASYLPQYQTDGYIQNRALIPEDNVEASLRPHIYIDPTTNQAGEIVCPFLWNNDSCDLVSGDYQYLGEMSIRELNQLRHANGATDSITISVFAWMEDCVVTAPTANDMAGLSPQSGMEGGKKKNKSRVTKTKNSPNKNNSPYAKQDEFGSGPVSGPASTVARVAGMLENAPLIGPYAKATQIAASGVANVAKLFGYSRPPSLAPDTIVENRPGYGMASSNLPDQTENLALDAKQELCVDGTVVGLDNTDEMTIKSIATRETWLDSTTWSTSDNVDRTLAWIAVTPNIHNTLSPGGGAPTEYHITASKFAAAPFKCWRGSMKYRFQVVSSAYHKGRLKIQWDPYGYKNQETNVQYTQIVDISDEKDFTIEVGWGHELGWLNVGNVNKVSYLTRSVGTSKSDTNEINGVLTVSVLNTLTSPSLSAGDTVELNMFVSCGDDIEFAVPTAQMLDHMTYNQPSFTPQSGMEETPVVQQDKDCTDEPSKPIQETALQTMGSTTMLADHNSDVYHGETITSFRSCLKRYQYVGMLPCGVAGGVENSEFITKHIPPVPGYNPGQAYWTNVATDPDNNYCKMTLMSYLYPAFVAVRGGVRWRDLLIDGDPNVTRPYGANYIRLAPETGNVAGDYKVNVLNYTSPGALIQSGVAAFPNTWSGISVSHNNQNNFAYADIPYQTMNRFWKARSRTKATRTEDRMVAHGYVGVTEAAGRGVACFCAASEDFSLHMFIGPPIVYKV